ncbi:MAG: hypothetical protein WC307_05240 [Candidatus Nanoarchaeia archaeon]|jgi:hypothetical protein
MATYYVKDFIPGFATSDTVYFDCDVVFNDAVTFEDTSFTGNTTIGNASTDTLGIGCGTTTYSVSGGTLVSAATSITLNGGNTTGDALVLAGSSADAGQKLTITGASGSAFTGDLSCTGNVTLSNNTCTLTHSGTTSLTIASTSGTVIVEAVTFTGGAMTGITAATVDNISIDLNTISTTSGALNLVPVAGSAAVIDAHWSFDGTTMTAITDNNTTLTAYTGKNVTIESVTFDGGVVAGVGSLTVDNLVINGNDIGSSSGHITLSPVAGSAIQLDGHWQFDGVAMTSLTDANTTMAAYAGKNITIESVTFDGGVVAGVTSLAIAGTGAAATSKALSTAGFTLLNGALDDGYGAVEVDLTLTGTATKECSALSSWINFDASMSTGSQRMCAITTGMYAPTGATLSNSTIIFGMRMDCLCQDATVTSSQFFPFSCVNNTNITTALFSCNAGSSDMGTITNAGADGGKLVPLYKETSTGTTYYVKLWTAL